jgi:hypothetical protein
MGNTKARFAALYIVVVTVGLVATREALIEFQYYLQHPTPRRYTQVDVNETRLPIIPNIT